MGGAGVRAGSGLTALWLVSFCLAGPLPLAAQTTQEYTSAVGNAARALPEHQRAPSPGEAIKAETARIAQEAQARISGLAADLDRRLARLASRRLLGWCSLAGLAVAGLLLLFLGWVLFESFFVPLACATGLATGGMVGLYGVPGLDGGTPSSGSPVLAAILGVSSLVVFLVTSRKARPIAAFLVVLCPFMMLSVFLFRYHPVIAVVTFGIGVVVGFLSMVQTRGVVIVTTSAAGSCLLVLAFGLVAHLLTGRMSGLSRAFAWLLGDMVALLIVVVVVAFVGLHFQYAARAPERG